MSDEIVSWCKTLWNGAGPFQGLQDIVCSPVGTTQWWCCHALLINLEPRKGLVFIIFAVKQSSLFPK